MSLLIKKNFIWIFIGLTVATCSILFAMEFTRTKPNIETKDAEKDAEIVTEKILVNNHYKFNVTHGKAPEKGLLIYISDSNSPTVAKDYAIKFAELSYYVASIDSQTLLSSVANSKNPCADIASALDIIGSDLKHTYEVDDSDLPILVGDTEGAALVYVALTQTDEHYFHAGLSINFAPHINTKIPLCLSNNSSDKTSNEAVNKTAAHKPSRIQLSPEGHLSTNWYIFQNAVTAKNVESTDFIEQVSNAKLTIAKKPAADSATHSNDSITEAIQLLQWLDPRLADQITLNNESNLPIIEVPTEVNSQKVMAVLVTGDGGWAEIDKHVAKILAEKGIPTVALDSLSYFWRERTQQETAENIDNIIDEYKEKWKKEKVILVGYSFGADVLPFIANNLSEKNRADVALVALLAMGKTAAFEFRLSSWIGADTNANRLPILPELKNMQWANSICIYGVDDEDTACKQTEELGVKTISMSGDHHFDENYNLLVQHIIENIK